MRSRLFAFFLFCLSGAAGSVTLDFSNATCNGGQACQPTGGAGSMLDQSHGDIAGVLDVSYRALTTAGNGPVFENFLRFWTTGYAGLTNVVWGAAGHSDYVSEIRLIPTAGNIVTLSGLQLGAWGGASTPSQVTIFDIAYNPLSASGSLAVGAAPLTFQYSLSSPTGLIIQWGPDGRNVAIDNIQFSVGPPAPVPEPAAYLMLAAGLALVAFRARFAARRSPV
jgi:hypothetical protein